MVTKCLRFTKSITILIAKKKFDLYVDTFMKLKQESNGVPKNCLKENGDVDEVKLRNYIEEYAAHEQVYLEKDKM